ncbi:MAG: sugar transferase [Anaerolineae bacterium]|nr:sugar transferase [Anaerolineae bacterium]
MNRRTIRSWTIVGDLLLINLAFAFAYVVRYEFQWLFSTTYRAPYSSYLGQQALLTLLLTIIFAQNKVWRRRRGEVFIDEIFRLSYATATGIALMMAFTFFSRPLAFSRLLLVWALIFIVLFLTVARLLRRIFLRMRYQRDKGVDRALIIGSGEAGRGVMRTLLARPDLGYRAVGYLADGNGENNIGLGRIPHLGSMHDLDYVLSEYPDLHTVFIALPAERHGDMTHLVELCQAHGVQSQVVPDLFQLSLHRVEFNNMAGIPMLSVREVGMSPAAQTVKRVLDVTVVLLLSPVALLVGTVIAIAIKLESPDGPVFYTAERVGQNGSRFRMAKFRSMVINAEEQKEALQEYNEASGPIFKIRNDPRLTEVGRIIRRLSLDELPQFWNVLKGDMSLVGPRPPLPAEVDCYQPWHRRRLEVKGGLTGLWQTSGRSDLTFDEQCLLDIYYIENWSLTLDIRLILQTVPYLLLARGAY